MLLHCVTFYTFGRCNASTNLALDDELINKARELGGHRTKKEAVTVALEEYIPARRLQGLLALEGQIDFDPSYDYNEERRRDSRRIPGWGQ